VLSRFVRERRVLDLAEAIRRMTSLPAELFSIPERGTVAVGMVADLVCFDPARIAHNGDFLNPSVPPEGIDWVMMAGRAVMTGGAWHGTRRGRRLEPA
jgi:dihydroorotase/N-acyl-D-amino-acid deacylase